jgi:hypothetical protein
VHVAPAGLGDLITVEVQGKAAYKPGEEIWLKPDLERCHPSVATATGLPL